MSSVEAMRRYRADPEKRRHEQRINACRAAALATLAARHPDEYEALCNQERAAVGLPPLGTRRGRPVTAVTSIKATPKATVTHVPAKRRRTA